MVGDPKALIQLAAGPHPPATPSTPDAEAFSNDQQLMHAVASGNVRARRVLARRLVKRTRNIAGGILGSGPDAEDAAQQSLLAILAAAPQYRGDAAIEGWAQSITVRVCVKVARARRRRATMTENNAEIESVATEPWDPLHEQLPKPLQVYFDRLPDKHREAVFMRYSLGFSLPEIAERTGASIPTVRYRLWTGLKKLRHWIAEDAS